MAPTKSTKGKTAGSKAGAKKTVSAKVAKAAGSAKGKKAGAARARPVPKEQKTSTVNAVGAKKKKRVYTEKELNIPALNMITPAGVQKPKGKKKGKVFVDDQESMMTILAMVNADKEGQIESKMMKARQMEEIRQARQAEMEARAQVKKNKLEDTKKSLRKSPKQADPPADAPKKSTSKKRVSFG